MLSILLWIVMTYNVENYFWPSRDQWEKTEHLGAVIAGDTTHEPPTFIGLQEVGSDSAIWMLTRWELRTLNYDYIRRPCQDPRGIAVALMYQREQFCPIMDSLVGEDLVARPPLYVKGLLLGDTIHLVVCHLPSQLGGASNDRRRRMLLERIGRLCEQIQKAERAPKILVMGDMNQELNQKQIGLLSGQTERMQPLLTGGSYYVQQRWEQIDQMLVSSALKELLVKSWMDERQWLMEQNVRGEWVPWRMWQETHLHHGYSDHLAGFAEFR